MSLSTCGAESPTQPSTNSFLVNQKQAAFQSFGPNEPLTRFSSRSSSCWCRSHLLTWVAHLIWTSSKRRWRDPSDPALVFAANISSCHWWFTGKYVAFNCNWSSLFIVWCYSVPSPWLRFTSPITWLFSWAFSWLDVAREEEDRTCGPLFWVAICISALPWLVWVLWQPSVRLHSHSWFHFWAEARLEFIESKY